MMCTPGIGVTVLSYDFLYEVSDGVATLTFNRPEVMNALTFEVYAQLRHLFEYLRIDSAVHTIVLTGAGDYFCSGGDVYKFIAKLLKRDTTAHLHLSHLNEPTVPNIL